MKRTLAEFHKKRIAAALPLRKGISADRVLAEIGTATRRFWRDSDAEARWESINLYKDTLVLKRRRYTAKGRPREKALHAYVRTLVTVYERATGRRIGRRVDAYAHDYREKPHPYLAVCMKAAGKRYPRRIIREVLESLHSH